MNLLARITATIGATAESAVSKFENHDAIAHSALVEARQAVAQALIRHKRLRRSVDEIRTNIEESEKQIEQWTKRAQDLAKTDESRAIQCLEHRRLCREQLTNHKQNLSKHEILEQGMSEKLKQLETRLQSMTTQHEEMRSRESLAQATRVMNKVRNQGGDGVDAIFERWELNISDTEVFNEVQQIGDSCVSSLQREMDEDEKNSALKGELLALLSESEEIKND